MENRERESVQDGVRANEISQLPGPRNANAGAAHLEIGVDPLLSSGRPRPSAKVPPRPANGVSGTIGGTGGLRPARELSTVELVRRITDEVSQLAHKQVELAKVEIKADLKAEAFTVGGMGLAIICALLSASLIMVTVVLALAQMMPAWLAGVVVAAFMLGVTGVVGLVAWHKRVRSPLERTRRALKENVQFAKEGLV